ncbi:hypothetical protein [Pseudomonas frederiksbergensis]|uniref:hypothetical protein n=1 Tax=Pseudomonas frederiksbergensis TaxID=104087 RepID=UPI003D25303B
MAALIPTLQHFARQPRQAQAPAGIDAVDFQRLASQVVDCGQISPGRGAEQARIPLRDQSPRRVMVLSGDECLCRTDSIAAQVGDLPDRQIARVVDTQLRCA